MKVVEKSDRSRHLIYDADAFSSGSTSSITSSIGSHWFDPKHYRSQGACVGEAIGRGATYIVLLEKQRCVLRHYWRGGLIAALLGDRYIWRGLTQTRAWLEWHLLAKLRELGLPVPQPLAAQVVRSGRFYRADLLTAKIENSQSLGDILRKKALPDIAWKNIGATLKRFHRHGVYHADLNAHNIMLDHDNQVYLIDFDKGYLRQPGTQHWEQENLERLKRSLDKLASRHQEFFMSDDKWWLLNQAYAESELGPDPDGQPR